MPREVMTLRTITTRPDLSIPELVESDIDNNLIIGIIDRPQASELRLVYAIKYYNPEKIYNWCGTDRVIKPSCRFYKWSVCHGYNLLEHITCSWKHWHDVPKMLICECIEDIGIICDEFNISRDSNMYQQLIDQFNSIRGTYDNH